MLDRATVEVIEECAKASHEGIINFVTVVARLMAIGVESYHADYRQGETTYYFPSGETHLVKLDTPRVMISDVFDVKGVQNAIRAAQSGELKYPAFMHQTMECGCVGYFVWIVGRSVQYFGRRGESHVEYFPA